MILWVMVCGGAGDTLLWTLSLLLQKEDYNLRSQFELVYRLWLTAPWPETSHSTLSSVNCPM